MIFIKLNFADETSAIISLDYVIVIYPIDVGIEIHLEKQEPIEFCFDLDEFYAKVFSDENMVKEYQVIEIDENKPFDLSKDDFKKLI